MTRDRWMDAAAASLVGIAALAFLREWTTTPDLNRVGETAPPEPLLALPAPKEALCAETIWETLANLGIRVPKG